MKLSAKVIKPAGGKLFDVQSLERGIEQELDRQAREVQQEFEKTTSTWSHKPGFSIQKSPWQREIGTEDKIYFFVNQGTGAHMIYPHGKFLRFQPGFSAKTSPGVIGSGAGGRSGNPVLARQVRHPGSKGRKFDKAIAKKWEPILALALQSVINRAVKA